MDHWSERLPEHACEPAIEWAKTQTSPGAAWEACERGF